MRTFKIGIIDDEKDASARLSLLIQEFAARRNLNIDVVTFEKPLAFIASFHCEYDILFLDIEMPNLNGIDLARKIREKDSAVTLIFVTNLAQYAIEGYSVQAFDYILKPVSESAFELKMSRLLPKLSAEVGAKITIRTNGSTLAVDANSIDYIEPDNHHVIYHVLDEVYESYEAMKEVEKRLPAYFVKCNRYYLVNLSKVTEVRGDSVCLGKKELKMSRTEKRPFLERLSDYLSRRGVV